MSTDMEKLTFADIYVPATNGLLWGAGGDIAGANEIVANGAFGVSNAENNFYRGKRKYNSQLESARERHPVISEILETGGGLLTAGAIGKLLKSGYGIAQVLRNNAQIRNGVKQLEEALRTQEFTEAPIIAGRINQERLDAINEMLRRQGGKELESDKLLWTKEGQGHLYDKRILHDKMTPQEVADIQKEVFFGKDSQVFNNSNKHLDSGALKAKHPEGEIRGYVQNKDGSTVGKTVFLRKRKR